MNPAWLSWDAPTPVSGFQGIKLIDVSTDPPDAVPRARASVTLSMPWSAMSPLRADQLQVTSASGAAVPPWSIESQVPVLANITLAFATLGAPEDYTLTLLDGNGAPLHPFLRSRRFTFALHCDRGDTRPSTAAAPRGPAAPRPAVDLLTKDYRGFLTMFAERARAQNPAWRDLAPASLERVLLELLAHHADMLSYFQDRVAAEAFLETATQRHSVRQHATLLGAQLFDGSAAETLLSFNLTPEGPGAPPLTDAVDIPEGTEVTVDPSHDDTGVRFHTTEPVRARAAHNRFGFAAWSGAYDAVIPAGATEVLLWGHVQGLHPGHRLCFTETAGSATRLAHGVTVREVEHLQIPGWLVHPSLIPDGTPSNVTRLSFDPPLPAPLAPWAPAVSVDLHGNLCRARHGALQVEQLPLTRAALTRLRDGVTVTHDAKTGAWHLRSLRLSRGPVLYRADEGASPYGPRSAPEVSVAVVQTTSATPWRRVEHLLRSATSEEHYTAHLDEDGALWLSFGDGKHGAPLALHEGDGAPPELRVQYRVGDPNVGNLDAGALSRFAPGSNLPARLAVRNVTPSAGGAAREPVNVARVRIPAALRRGPIARVVTLDDYAKAARIPGVARAFPRRIGGPFGAVQVLLDPVGEVRLRDELREEVSRRLDGLRLAGCEVLVRAPDYVPLDVSLAVCVTPGVAVHTVRDAVLRALLPGSAERPGFFHPDRLGFGQSVELGELLALVQSVAGVRSVKALRFRRLRGRGAAEVESILRLTSAEVARLDADPAVPDNGRLSVRVVGVDLDARDHDFTIEDAP